MYPIANGSIPPQGPVNGSMYMGRGASNGSTPNNGSYVVLSNSSSGQSRSPHDFSYINPAVGSQISMTDITLEQALDKVQDLAQENQGLRECLKQNNEMMRKQFETLAQWKDKVRVSNQQNVQVFQKKQETIQVLQREIASLRQKIEASGGQGQIQSGSVVDELQRRTRQLEEEKTANEQKVVELRRQVEDLSGQLTAHRVGDLTLGADTVFVSKKVEDEEQMDRIVKEKEILQTRGIQLEAQVRNFREQNDQLMKDLESVQKLKDQIQGENSKLLEENFNLQKKLQSYLTDMKEQTLHSGGAESVRNYGYSMVQASTETEEKQTAALQAKQDMEVLEMQTAAHDRCESFCQTDERNLQEALSMSDITTQLKDKLNVERNTVSELKHSVTEKTTLVTKLQSELQEKQRMIEHYKQQRDVQLARVTQEHQQKEDQMVRQLDQLNTQLQQTKSEQSMTYNSDIQSLKSQVLTLINEVHESGAKLEAATKALDKKSARVVELENQLTQLNEQMQLQRSEADALIQSLRTSLTGYEDTLHRERDEHVQTKKQTAELRSAFNTLVSDYKELLDTFDDYKLQKERQGQQGGGSGSQMMDEINRLTAQTIAAEEAITYRDEEIRKLRDEVKHLKGELENTIPVLRAQAEVWKQDFDAERNARERQHAEKEKILGDMKNLEIQNQQLLDELENYSRKSLIEMQRRYAPASYQQQVQGRLQVGGSPQSPGAQRGYPSESSDVNSEASPDRQHHVQPTNRAPSQTSSGSQDEGETPVMSCPKCGLQCPDLDTLQIHVLECIDQ